MSLACNKAVRYQDKAIDELVDLLHKAKEQLRKYGHVNKKAVDQYVHFNEQREELEARKKELDESEKSIFELIKVLDEKKFLAIELTFKMVRRYP